MPFDIPSSLNLDIRRWLARYLAGDISLKAFDDWFAPATWNISREHDPEARKLAYEITHRLAEFTDGYWTERELQMLLQPLEENYAVTVRTISHAAPPLPTWSTSSVTVSEQAAVSQEPAMASRLAQICQGLARPPLVWGHRELSAVPA